MNGISAGFVKGLVAGHIGANFVFVQLAEGHKSGFVFERCNLVRRPNQADRSDHLVRLAGEQTKHAGGIEGSAGLSQNQTADRDNRIRTQNQAAGGRAGGHTQRLGASNAPGVIFRKFSRNRHSLIDAAGNNLKIEAGVAQQLDSARGIGGKKQLHACGIIKTSLGPNLKPFPRWRAMC